MFIGKLPHQADLLGALAGVAAENGIRAGMVQVTGALQRAKVGFYDQWMKAYRELPFNEPLEIVSGVGNVSQRDGAPFVHLHLSLSNSEGKVIGGRGMEGCIIFAAEFFILPLPGIEPIRTLDETTGLQLWRQALYATGREKELSPELQRALFNP
ncbi:MAG: DNA-binding protein [Desulfuromonadales bacterium]|nr:MAG: DNA-binding protein [Desulfuromonadales bacterium]